MTFLTSFESFLRSLAPTSEGKYRTRSEHFIDYCEKESISISAVAVHDYIEEMHEKYMTSTLWSIIAILKSYFQLEHQIDLQPQMSGVIRLLKLWQKSDETSQSKVIMLFSMNF